LASGPGRTIARSGHLKVSAGIARAGYLQLHRLSIGEGGEIVDFFREAVTLAILPTKTTDN
jgi:hypothetical protein